MLKFFLEYIKSIVWGFVDFSRLDVMRICALRNSVFYDGNFIAYYRRYIQFYFFTSMTESLFIFIQTGD